MDSVEEQVMQKMTEAFEASRAAVPNTDGGWAAYWGQQAVASLRAALVASNPHRELDAEHAVRAGRLAYWHACRVAGYRYWDRNFLATL